MESIQYKMDIWFKHGLIISAKTIPVLTGHDGDGNVQRTNIDSDRPRFIGTLAYIKT